MTEHDFMQRHEAMSFFAGSPVSSPLADITSKSRRRRLPMTEESIWGWHSIDARTYAIVAAVVVIVMHMLPFGVRSDKAMVAKTGHCWTSRTSLCALHGM
jgi:hypothetical protein